MKISRRRLADYVKTLHQKACCTIIFLNPTNKIIDLWCCRWRCPHQILNSLISKWGKPEKKTRERRRPANHPFSQSVDWIAKGAAQRSRTEGAVLPVRRSAPEHDPYMTSEHSTTARWIRLGVNFEEGGNRSARRKPSKSGWDRLKLKTPREAQNPLDAVL